MKRILTKLLIQIVFLTLSIVPISCEKLTPNELEIKRPVDFLEVFDEFWQGMNENYLYWDIDSTDWVKQYNDYHKIFSELNLNEPDDVSSSVRHFRLMTSQIVDGHLNIQFTHPALIDSVIYPIYDRKKREGELHYLYSYLPYDSIYLDEGFAFGIDDKISGFVQPLICLTGTIDRNIIYFSCNFFALMRSLQKYPHGTVANALNHFSQLLNNRTDRTKGVIIDVRGNPGGDLADLNFLLGQLVSEPLHFGFSQYKRSSYKTDYTPWIPAFVNPTTVGNNIESPIVVIADNYSASLSESCVLAIRAMPNSTFIGENTWGATGPVIDSEVYQSGSFEVEGFMNVQASSCRFKDLEGHIYESKGISPDFFIPYNAEAYTRGIDLQLEKAIEILEEN